VSNAGRLVSLKKSAMRTYTSL